MPTDTTSSPKRRYCSDCGTLLNTGARFCHDCGSPLEGRGSTGPATLDFSKKMRWGVPVFAIVALVALSVTRLRSPAAAADSAARVPLDARTVQASDISSLSADERADRLFNRVMRLSSEGKKDSAAFFVPMALGSLEALRPLNAHRRYDMGLVVLVSGDVAIATAQADTILRERATHLLGLSLAARAADARGDAAAARDFRRRLLAAEPTERARALPEYTDHDADIRTAVELARKR